MSAPLKVSVIAGGSAPELHLESVPARGRRTLARVSEVVALAALFGLSLEAACRVEDWVQFRTPIFARERSQEDLLVRDKLGMHGRAYGHFQKWSLNAFGMRGPDVPQVKGALVLRVVTAGASETFGLYESPGQEYPRQLQDSLNARLALPNSACPGFRAEVLNSAMPGMSLPTIDQDIRLRVSPLKPDVVVLYATPSAYLEDDAPVAARRDTSNSRVSGPPARYALWPRAADRIRVQLKALLPSAVQDQIRKREIRKMLAQHPSGWRFDSVPTERLNRFELDLRQAIGSVRAIGATPALMTHGNRFVGSTVTDGASLRAWEKFYPRASGETIVAFDSVARLRTIAVARDSGIVLVDLAPVLAGARAAVFADFSHFNNFGASIAADVASRSILAGVACPELSLTSRQ